MGGMKKNRNGIFNYNLFCDKEVIKMKDEIAYQIIERLTALNETLKDLICAVESATTYYENK